MHAIPAFKTVKVFAYGPKSWQDLARLACRADTSDVARYKDLKEPDLKSFSYQ